MAVCDVLVVGGGISGLSLAWQLTQEGLSVEVWEAGDRPGGKICSTQKDGYLTERAASMVMNFRPEITKFIHETGLEHAKTPRSRVAEKRRYLLHKGQLTALPMKLGPMLASPLWSLRGKLRLLLEPFIPPGSNNDETVSQFISRRLGRELLEKAMEPFVAGTLAADPDLTSAATALPRLTQLEKRYGSITAGIFINRLLRKRTACVHDTFSFQGGMSTLMDTLARAPGIQVATGHKVSDLSPTSTGWQVSATTKNGARDLSAKHVVLATPSYAAADLLTGLDNELAQLLGDIQYAPITVMHMGWDRSNVQHPLDGTGFLTPKRENLPITGNLWMSTLFNNRAPKDKILLTSYLGGARLPAVREWDDARCTAETLQALNKLLGLKADPEMVRLDRHRKALPLYYGAYQNRMQMIDARLKTLPNLHLEANYRGGISVRDRIARSGKLAKSIVASFPRSDRFRYRNIVSLATLNSNK